MKVRHPRRITIDVLSTLIRREWRHRLSQGRWLTVWTIVEPLVQIFAISLIYSAFQRTSVDGHDAVLFLAVGIFGFIAFRNMTVRPCDAIVVSSGLMVYRQVHVLDLLVAKWAAEAGTYVMLGALGLGYLFLFEESIQIQPLKLMFAMIVALGLSLGVCCALACLRRRYPWATTYFRPVFFGLYVTSGALHPVWELPEAISNVLVWNPIVQLLEVLRESVLYRYDSPLGFMPVYLLFWALLCLLWGASIVLHHSETLRTR